MAVLLPPSQAVAGRASIEEKSRAFIQQQQAQLEQLSQAKVRGQLAILSTIYQGPTHFLQEGSERQVRELQQQLSQLRSQLSTSESTQKDFVQLSQSLQVSQGWGRGWGRGQVLGDAVLAATQVQLAAMEETRQAGDNAEAAIKT